MKLRLLKPFPAAVLLLAGCARDASGPRSASAGPIAGARAPATPDGAVLYAKNCAVCHMVDGSGVPYMQPALTGKPALAGDPTLAIRVLLFGPGRVLPPDHERYSNKMPSFVQLSDAEIAALVTYIRYQFADGALGVTAAQVAALRRPGPDNR
ncbi:MAG: hypothetical protein A3G75_08010 [Verrucomicrobia bacterium RIFCSPLOWO2_12_FULL_64_8]|nr:MAG: hypothetical protein A3G75_08010 [Verrucomicrobia bacterium RIFCSPLOWO2_12_FULL_64_8]